MNSLTDSHPSTLVRLTDSTIFYFGSKTSEIHLLPGKSRFQVVYSPREQNGWEFVSYQLFEEKNGVSVLERRTLEMDEITYFEGLLYKVPYS
ncbi:MAG: hypothetical protein ABI970_03125 [Chloroflexota bacterium]|nr:hypothetical protein [Anaerolineae bacterium]